MFSISVSDGIVSFNSKILLVIMLIVYLNVIIESIAHLMMIFKERQPLFSLVYSVHYVLQERNSQKILFFSSEQAKYVTMKIKG